jgi:hypothetical protein
MEKEKVLKSLEKLETLEADDRTILYNKSQLIQNFQKSNGPEIRNWFAHFGSYFGPFELESKEDIRKILEVVKICLDTIE